MDRRLNMVYLTKPFISFQIPSDNFTKYTKPLRVMLYLLGGYSLILCITFHIIRTSRQAELEPLVRQPLIAFVDLDHLYISHFQSSQSLATFFLFEVEDHTVTSINIGNSICLVNLNPCLR
jgi:hypothetical protein